MKYFLKDIKSPTKIWKKALLIITGIAIGLYLLFMGLYFPTSEPSFCASCHQVIPYVTSWRQSPHKDVKCLYCHEFRGFVGKLHSKTRGLNFVYQQWTGQYTIFSKGQVFEQNCIGCHLGDYYNYRKTKRLDSKHYNFIKNDRSCLECHRNSGHEVNIFSKQKFK